MQNDRKIKRKVRNSYIISTVSIAMVLFLLGTVGYIIINALKASNKLQESMSVYVMLEDNLTGDINALKDRLTGMDEVLSVEFISKEAAAGEFAAYLGSDFIEFLDYNPLPDSFEIKTTASNSDKESLEQLETTLLMWPEVSEVIYQKNVVEQISTNINKFNLILVLFGATMLVISLILLNNTIRITVLSKRYVISTMKLVGANRWFIIKPFIKTSVMQGIYSALIASIMLGGIITGLNEGLPELTYFRQNMEIVWLICGIFVTGILISSLFTFISVNKFIKLHSDAVYLY